MSNKRKRNEQRQKKAVEKIYRVNLDQRIDVDYTSK